VGVELIDGVDDGVASPSLSGFESFVGGLVSLEALDAGLESSESTGGLDHRVLAVNKLGLELAPVGAPGARKAVQGAELVERRDGVGHGAFSGSEPAGGDGERVSGGGELPTSVGRLTVERSVVGVDGRPEPAVGAPWVVEGWASPETVEGC
jgi:hypothetical protein